MSYLVHLTQILLCIHLVTSSSRLNYLPRQSSYGTLGREGMKVTQGQQEHQFLATNSVKSNSNSKCCGESVSDDVINLRIEKIKSQILQKLRLNEPPSHVMSKSMLPSPLAMGEILGVGNAPVPTPPVVDDYYGKTEQIVILAESSVTPTCQFSKRHNPSGCFHFNILDSISDKDISSAMLWTYKLSDRRDIYNQTYVVSEVPTDYSENGKRKNTVSIRETEVKEGWITFDLTPAVKRWVLSGTTDSASAMNGLKISCTTCAKEVHEIPVSTEMNKRPFIIIETDQKNAKSRGRRAPVTCLPDTTYCCRERLYVNFTQIGWDSWILQPEGYMANYCKGSCMEDFSVTQNTRHYALVLQQLKHEGLAPCCTGSKMSTISLLYMDDRNVTQKKNLPGMVVEECGCS